MRIRVLRDRRLVPPNTHNIAVQYIKGGEHTVKREWGDILVAAGDAEEIEATHHEPDEQHEG
jgi:hypothetical protein